MKRVIFLMVLTFLLILPIGFSEPNLHVSPQSFSFDIIGTKDWNTIFFENRGDEILELQLKTSDSIRDYVEIEKENLVLNPKENDFVRFRIDFPNNKTSGSILINGEPTIDISLNKVQEKREFNSTIDEIVYEANYVGSVAVASTLSEKMMEFFLVPKISTLADFLFLRITLFIGMSIVLITAYILLAKPDKMKIIILISGFVLLVSLLFSLLIPTVVL